jgi:hypothetical protein
MVAANRSYPYLNRLVGTELGIEIVSKVNDIPKGSRLAVSTNLLGSFNLPLHASHWSDSVAGG